MRSDSIGCIVLWRGVELNAGQHHFIALPLQAGRLLQEIFARQIVAALLDRMDDGLRVDVAGQGDEIARIVVRHPFLHELYVLCHLGVIGPGRIAGLLR